MKPFAAMVAGMLAVSAGPAEELAKPLPKQIRFADWEVGAFFHYDLNPFTDQEHGDGQEPPARFNPTDLDMEQWILTAKALGARYAVLTARHEGGFCLWPTQTTEYSIKNSPYKNGKGDLVKEFVEACRRHGIEPGLYHTAGFDANAAIGKYKGDLPLPLEWGSTWGKAVSEGLRKPGRKEEFYKKQVEQMRELLTWYGPISFIWSDHWDATDPNGVWRAVTDLAEELQPELVFMGPDTWVPGNETGHVVYPMWNAVETKDGTKYSRPAAGESTKNSYGLLEGDVPTGEPFGKFWRVRECTTAQAFHYGGWFWHPDHVKKTYPKKTWEHLDLYYRTVGLGANTIINLPPNTTGRIPDDIAAAAKAFGDEIRARFSNPIAKTEGIQKGDVVELKWREPKEINTIVTMENIANGQKVAKYSLEAFVNGRWQQLEPRNRLVAQKPYNGNPGYETVGHKKIDRVKPVTTDRIRFRTVEAIARPVEIRSLAVYHCAPIVRTFDAEYPYLSGVDTLFDEAHGGMKRDLDYRGGPLELDGKTYKRGLLLCPVGLTGFGVAEFDMALAPKAKGLAATIGIEDMVGRNGSCEFIVEGLVEDSWQELYKSPVLRGGDKAMEIKVEFPKGMEQLRLKTTVGGNNASSDHAVWAAARFTE